MATQEQSELEKLIREFLEYLEVERDVSPLTVRNYTHYLKRFNDWMWENGCGKLEQITQDNVRQYRLYISRLSDGQGGTLSKKTQGYHAIALRSFLKYLIRRLFTSLFLTI